jgi:hypothetical protein
MKSVHWTNKGTLEAIPKTLHLNLTGYTNFTYIEIQITAMPNSSTDQLEHEQNKY